MLQAAGAVGAPDGLFSGSGSSSHVLDEEGQQYLEVQRHAAAVQLLNRSLAVAHLRAEAVRPRGQRVAPQRKPAHIKTEAGADDQQQVQEAAARLWHAPQQPTQAGWGPAAQTGLVVRLSSSLEGQAAAGAPPANTAQQQRQQQQPVRKTLRRSYKPPDAAAAAKWLHDEQAAAEAAGAAADAAASLPMQPQHQQQAQLAPRITADPALQAQQLSGWLRLGADGVTVEGGGPAAAGEQQAAGAGMVEAAAVGGGAEENLEQQQQQQQPPDEDFMDEEEWV